jgi:hypothetical protein
MDAIPGPAAVATGDGRPRGSAFRISKRLLLTAGHIVQDVESLKVRLFCEEDFIDCEVLWIGSDLDAALLRISGTQDPALPDFHPADVGQFVGVGRWDCDVTGYSLDWDRDDLMARRLTGTLDSGSYPGANFLALELPRPIDHRGLGGAAAHFEGKVIGVVSRYSTQENILILVPAACLLKDTGFQAAIRSDLGRELNVIQLTPPDTAVVNAIKSVSKADPKNIQEVAAASFDLSDSYYANVLSQAKRSFNVAVVAGIAGSLFFLAAVVLALTLRDLSAPLISSIGGAIVEVVSGLNFWLYSRTAIQLNSFHMRLERMQRYLVANSVAASLEGEHQATTLQKLVMVISGGESRHEPQ